MNGCKVSSIMNFCIRGAGKVKVLNKIARLGYFLQPFALKSCIGHEKSKSSYLGSFYLFCKCGLFSLMYFLSCNALKAVFAKLNFTENTDT